MDDQPLVREVDGAAYQPEQRDPLAEREALLAVRGDRDALDVLHDEVGHAVLRAAVEQPRDVRVLEPGEDLPLETEALAQSRSRPVTAVYHGATFSATVLRYS